MATSKKTFRSRIVLTLIVCTVLVALAAVELQRRWKTPLAIPSGGYHLIVAPGDSLRMVAANLHKMGIVDYPSMLIVQGRWSGLDRKIKQGEYVLPQYLNIKSLLLLLSQGKVVQHQITLPEGITLIQAIAILAKEAELEHTISGPGDTRILALIAPKVSAEGLFFPDSYHYERGSSDWDILLRAYQRMQTVLEQEWSTQASGLPLSSAYEALILASIIERETGKVGERADIAGVFVRRLNKRMRLQTDPSVIYGLGSTFDGNLRRVHLKDSSNPYNTYRHKGLPPSPIALPGRAAIHAALNPAQGDTLFFVARGDGGHEFSSNLKDHETAVRKYQLKRRADYRSSVEK